jgi:Holliday junction resolvasome RuvABC endonuclease subunit
MPAPVILATDLSTRVGWAVGRDFEPPRHGVWMLRGPGLGSRCSSLAACLEDAIEVFRPHVVIMEAPLPPQAQTAAVTARLQFGLAAVCEMICHECEVRCEEAAAYEVRRLILGRARAEKAAVVAWCREQGLEPADDNAADALCLLRYRHVLGRARVTAGAAA